MGIALGNFTVEQIQNRLGINLTEEETTILSEMRQDNAQNIAKDKWHCFDMPFVIVCGCYDTAVKVHNILKPYSNKMKCQLQISLEENSND